MSNIYGLISRQISTTTAQDTRLRRDLPLGRISARPTYPHPAYPIAT